MTILWRDATVYTLRVAGCQLSVEGEHESDSGARVLTVTGTW